MSVLPAPNTAGPDPESPLEDRPDLPVPNTADPDPESPLEDRPDEDEFDGDGTGGRMSFLDHLDELRKRLTISISAVFVGFLLAFTIIVPITAFVMRPLRATLPEGGEFIYTEPTEAFFLYIKVAALVGLIFAIPVVLWQLWLFVAPGLYSNEKRFAIPFVTHDIHAKNPANLRTLRTAHAGLWSSVPDANTGVLLGSGWCCHRQIFGTQYKIRNSHHLYCRGRSNPDG